jgi:hypothetical protein
MQRIWGIIGGRKFLVLIFATIGLLVGKLTSSDWVIVAGIYTAGNIARGYIKGNKENSAS